jgi:HEAT repeat protein
MENDPRAVTAVAALDDDRLARHLLEFIAERTWAGKPFVVPRPLRTAYARTRLRTLFLPEAGMNPVHAEGVLLEAAKDNRPAMRETALYILGIVGSRTAIPVMINALQDPVPSVRLQAAKALGRVGDPSAIPALLNALPGADEQMGAHIFSALVHVGHAAVPALIEKSASQSAWIRWHCMRALGEIGDGRALPVLVGALCDPDHSAAWMAAKGLVRVGRRSIGPVLSLLMTAEMSRWLAETASFVLRDQCVSDPRLKPYLEPVLQDMRSQLYHIATPLAAQKALSQLIAKKLIEPGY